MTKERVAPEQALTRMEALRCATADGAYLTFDEDKKGSLQAGKYADLAVLSADPLTAEDTKLADITSSMTMIGGRIVHRDRGLDGLRSSSPQVSFRRTRTRIRRNRFTLPCRPSAIPLCSFGSGESEYDRML